MLSLAEKEKVVEIIYSWRNLSELREFAVNRSGFGNSNGGFGVTYEHDLDDYDREVTGSSIPKNCVEIYGFWGKPEGYVLHISEIDYLLILSEVLHKQGLDAESKDVLKKIMEIT